MSEMIRQQANTSTILSEQLRGYVDHQTQQQEARWQEIQQSIMGNQAQQQRREPEQPVYISTEQAHQPEPNQAPRGPTMAPQIPNLPPQATPSPQPVIVQNDPELTARSIEREEVSEIRQIAQTHWPTPTKLTGREDYAQWESAIIRDAQTIGARAVLQLDDSPSMDRIELAKWQARSALLFSRIVSTIPSHHSHDALQTMPSVNAICRHLHGIYSMSYAERRLLRHKELLAIPSPNTNMDVLKHLFDTSNTLLNSNYSASEIYHDIVLLILGEANRGFMQPIINTLFNNSRHKNVHMLDVREVLSEYEAQTRTPTSGNYSPTKFTVFRQDPWRSPISREKPVTDKGKAKESDSQPKRSSKSGRNSQPLCPYCKKGRHQETECWTKHPDKRPPPENDRQQNQANGTANSVNVDELARADEEWVLDTGTGWTITHDRSLFISFLPVNSSKVNLPNESDNSVLGIGTIRLPFGDKFIVQNARYVPAFKRKNLLSFSHAVKLGFKIDYIDDSQLSFAIRSPDDHLIAMAHAERDSDSVYVLQQPNNGTFTGAVTTRQSARALSNTAQGGEMPPKANQPIQRKGTPILDDQRPKPAPIDVWHHRTGHLHQQALVWLHQKGKITIDGTRELTPCHYCRAGKMTRNKLTGEPPRAVRPGQRLHVDVFGGGKTLGQDDDIGVPLGDGIYKYVMLITDDATRRRWAIPLRDRKGLVDILFSHIDWLKAQGLPPAFVRADNEFFPDRARYERASVHPEPTTSYTPWQDGVSERGIRTILERTRAALYASGLERRYWLRCLMDTVFKANHLPTSINIFHDFGPGAHAGSPGVKPSKYKLPMEAWFDKPIGIGDMIAFGTTVWYHKHGSRAPTDKMDSRGAKGLFLGYDSSFSIAWVLDIADDKIIRVGGIQRDEVPISLRNDEFIRPFTVSRQLDRAKGGFDEPGIDGDDSEHLYRPANGFAAVTLPVPTPTKPSSLTAAMKRADKDRWFRAMERELVKLKEKDVWELVREDDVPPDARIYPGRWVYDTKEGLDPSDERFCKARWVIKGNLIDKNQLEYDYHTYAPVVSPHTTRLLFAAAAWKEWTIRRVDVSVAFLNGELKDTIYMRQPTKFEEGTKLVCKLKHSLYGLTPAARIWYDTLSAYLRHVGFDRSEYDHGLFIHREKRNVYLTSHVDDFMIVAERPEDAQWVIDTLNNEYELKILDDIKYFLGMDVEMSGDGIHLHQAEYIKELVDSFRLTNAHPKVTPLDPGLIIDDEPDPSIDIREYQRGVGSLQWLTTKTRLDIAFAATILAQYSAKPTRKCWNSLIHVLRYLAGTPHRGLFYRKRPDPTKGFHLPDGFSDSDWASHNMARKSIGASVFLAINGPIMWFVRKQTCVATSSNEAEYMAASEASKEAIWLRRVFSELRFSVLDIPPIALHMDNQGAMALTSNEGTKRSKHIDTRFHHIRDSRAMGLITVKGVPSTDMAADGLTKPLSKDKFRQFLMLIRMDDDDSKGGPTDGMDDRKVVEVDDGET